MVGGLLAGRLLIEPAARGDVGLVAHNRVDVCIAALLIELQCAVQIAMVGERQRIHPQLFGPRDQRIDGAGAVQQAKVTMTMQMDKGLSAHHGSFQERTNVHTRGVEAILTRRGGRGEG